MKILAIFEGNKDSNFTRHLLVEGQRCLLDEGQDRQDFFDPKPLPDGVEEVASGVWILDFPKHGLFYAELKIAAYKIKRGEIREFILSD